MKSTLIIICLTAMGITARASQRFEVGATGSKSDSQLDLIYQYNQPAEEATVKWSTSVNVISNRAKIRDSNTGEVDRTGQLIWSNNWNLYNMGYVELNVGGSNTKADELSSRKFEVKGGSDFGEDLPFSWSLAFGRNRITQGQALPSLQKLGIDQKSMNYSFGLDATDWLIVSFYGSQYDYDQDLEDQLLRLGTPGAVRIYGTAFYDTLSALPKESVGLQASFIINDQWGLSVDLSKITDAPDPQVESGSFSMTVNYQMNTEWDFAARLASTRVESTATNSEEKFGYFGFSVGYTWP